MGGGCGGGGGAMDMVVVAVWCRSPLLDKYRVSLLGGFAPIHTARPPCPQVNPLWTPDWPTVPAALRRVAARDAATFSQEPKDVLESQLLSCLGGHNLCCDVFGDHSAGEVRSWRGRWKPPLRELQQPHEQHLLAG